VLNVGLSAGILTQLVFSMFVLEALTLTCITTPLVTILYPLEKRVRISATGTFSNLPGEVPELEGRGESSSSSFDESAWKHRFTFVLDKLEHLPSMMALAQLLPTPPPAYNDDDKESSHRPSLSVVRMPEPRPGAAIDALRLIELTRTSEVMKASAVDTFVHTDPLLNIFRMFGELQGLPVTPSLSIVPYDDLANTVGEHARTTGSQLVIVPWLPPRAGQAALLPSPAPSPTRAQEQEPATSYNPFSALFRSTGSTPERAASVQHSIFVRRVFAQAATDVALFFDCALEPTSVSAGRAKKTHIFLPFFGGPDDRLALDFVVQLCASPDVTASVVRIAKRDGADDVGTGADAADYSALNSQTVASTAFPDTVYGPATTTSRLQSKTADGVAWERYASPGARAQAEPALAVALARVAFSELATPSPLRAAVQRGGAARANGARPLVVLGRSRRLAAEDHTAELRAMGRERIGSEVRKTVGDVATAFVLEGVRTGILVMQAVVAAA
jgi:hypothetical protein